LKSFSLSPEVVNNRKVLVKNICLLQILLAVSVRRSNSNKGRKLGRKLFEKKRKEDSFSPFITIEVR